MGGINLRSRRKKNIYPKATIIVLLVIALILARATWNVFIKNRETKENLVETVEYLDDLKKRGANIEEEIQDLSTERGIDREIREKFRVVKEGEGMIMLIDSPESYTASSTNEDKSLWSRVMDLF